MNKHKATEGNIIVRMNRKTDEVVMENGVKLYIHIDELLNGEQHRPRRGKLLSTNDNIPFQYKDMATTFNRTTNELLEGDDVILTRNSVSQAIYDENYFEDNGDICIIVKYREAICAIRNDEVIPVNGWLICEAVKETPNTTLEVPEELLKNSNKLARVIYVGKPNEEYTVAQDMFFDEGIDVVPNDIVVFFPGNAVDLEYDIHRSLEGKRNLFRLRRFHLLGKINK